MARSKSRGRGQFPWEYDSFSQAESRAQSLKGRRKQKAMTQLEKNKQRARRARAQVERPLDAGIPKMIRPWPQGWRVPTSKRPMTRKEYAAYLQTPHWQEFRDRYQGSDHLQECFVCGASRFALHHHTYARLGREDLADVIPLCDEHHRAVHKAVKAGVSLRNAHTYVKMRFQRGELGLRKSSLEDGT